jgi:hypothetical protein
MSESREPRGYLMPMVHRAVSIDLTIQETFISTLSVMIVLAHDRFTQVERVIEEDRSEEMLEVLGLSLALTFVCLITY